MVSENKLFSLSKVGYKAGKDDILTGIDLDVDIGSCFCLLGQNGSGKSTLIDLIVGDLSQTSGVISFYKNRHLKTLKSKLSVLYDIIPFYPMLKVKEVLHLFSMTYNISYGEKPELINILGLEGIMNRLFYKLSKGERKKVGLFVCLCHSPEILIMDEPTAELDPIVREKIWKSLILTENRTVFFTTHNWEEAEKYADKVAFLYDGKIISTLSDIEKQNIQGKKVIVSKQVELPDNIINETEYFVVDNQYHFLPKHQTEREFLKKISSITLNYSVENKKLEDIYQLLIKKANEAG